MCHGFSLKSSENRVWGRCEIEFGVDSDAMGSPRPATRKVPGLATTKDPIASAKDGLTPFQSREEIRQEDGLVAVRTRPAGTHPPTEGPALRAALLTEIPGLAGRAFVDRG